MQINVIKYPKHFLTFQPLFPRISVVVQFGILWHQQEHHQSFASCWCRVLFGLFFFFFFEIWWCKYASRYRRTIIRNIFSHLGLGNRRYFIQNKTSLSRFWKAGAPNSWYSFWLVFLKKLVPSKCEIESNKVSSLVTDMAILSVIRLVSELVNENENRKDSGNMNSVTTQKKY